MRVSQNTLLQSKMKKKTEEQWKAAIELLVECLERSQTQIVQVLNDPGNPKHHVQTAAVFNWNNTVMIMVKKKMLGGR